MSEAQTGLEEPCKFPAQIYCPNWKLTVLIENWLF